MEIFLYYVVNLVLVLVPLYVVFSLCRKGSADTKNLPPGSKGWPLLGETMEYFLSGPQKFVKDRMEKYSQDVFRTSLFGEEMAVLCGPKGNKFVFKNEKRLFTTWWPQSVMKSLLFVEEYESNAKQASARRDSMNHDNLSPEAIKRYIPVMDAVSREHIDRDCAPNSVVKVFDLAQKYTFGLSCKLFFNLVDPEQIKKLADPFVLVVDGLVSLPIDFPGTAYNRAMKGGRILKEELLRIIKDRRKELMENDESQQTKWQDLLSRVLLITDENGEYLSEKEISNYFTGLLVASFGTTSSLITSIMYYLASQPDIYKEVLKEQMEIANSKHPNELLTWDDIEKMKYSWNVARETMRLMPPAQGAFRETETDFTYAGYTIPKGSKTFWTVNSSNRNPEYFPEPEKFDPSRFNGSGPAPYTFVPFGGGAHMCSGSEYARLEVLVFLHNVMRMFKFEKAIPNEKIVIRVFPNPVHGLPIRLQAHQK